MNFKRITIVLAILISMFAIDAKAQPPYDITIATYKNYAPNEIPASETLWTYDLLGIMYDQFKIQKFSNYCSGVFENQDYCNGAWSSWKEGVYNVKHPSTGCELRVEYRWRMCLSDHKIRQHEILGIFFETSDWPWNTDCDDLQDWLYNGNTSVDKERLHLLFEDMYQKIALVAFLDDNTFSQQQLGHPIYCSDTSNIPTKIYHINGSCENYCYCTYRTPDGKAHTWISKDKCTEYFCCVVANTYCVDDLSGKVRWSSEITYSTEGAEAACDSAAGGDPWCWGETCVKTECLFTCSDEYCVHDYDHTNWNNYIFRDIYSDILDPSFFPQLPPPIRNSVKTIMCNDNNIINAYPNPANNELNISLNLRQEQIKEFSIRDSKGITISEINLNNIKELNTLDLSKYSSGCYYILVKTNETKYIKKFLINK